MLRIFSFIVDTVITFTALFYMGRAQYPLFELLLIIALLCGANAVTLIWGNKYSRKVLKYMRPGIVIANYILLILLAVVAYAILSVGSDSTDPTSPGGAMVAVGSISFAVLTIVGNLTYMQRL